MWAPLGRTVISVGGGLDDAWNAGGIVNPGSGSDRGVCTSFERAPGSQERYWAPDGRLMAGATPLVITLPSSPGRPLTLLTVSSNAAELECSWRTAPRSAESARRRILSDVMGLNHLQPCSLSSTGHSGACWCHYNDAGIGRGCSAGLWKSVLNRRTGFALLPQRSQRSEAV